MCYCEDARFLVLLVLGKFALYSLLTLRCDYCLRKSGVSCRAGGVRGCGRCKQIAYRKRDSEVLVSFYEDLVTKLHLLSSWIERICDDVNATGVWASSHIVAGGWDKQDGRWHHAWGTYKEKHRQYRTYAISLPYSDPNRFSKSYHRGNNPSKNVTRERHIVRYSISWSRHDAFKRLFN